MDGPLRLNRRILGRTVLHQPGNLKPLTGGAVQIRLRVISHIETLLGRISSFLQDDVKELIPGFAPAHLIGNEDGLEALFQSELAKSTPNGQGMIKIRDQDQRNIGELIQKGLVMIREVHGAKQFIHVDLDDKLRYRFVVNV